jgi:hypothetical protein
VAVGDQLVEHVAVQVAPARLAVKAQDGVTVALVEVVQAQAVDLHVVRLVREAGQIGEALVGSAEDVQGVPFVSG